MHVEELPWPDQVVRFYAAIRHLPWAQWLDSGEGPLDSRSRWHLMVAAPRLRILVRNGRCQVLDDQGRECASPADPFQALREALRVKRARAPGLPFTGGALGYFGYELGYPLQGLPSLASSLPEMAVGIYDWSILLDRKTRRCWIAGENIPPPLPGVLARAAQQETQWEGQWHGGPAELLVGRDRYLAAIDRIHRYLRAGDCYQVNYAQPLEAPFSGDPLALYQQMRKRNPSPYGAFLAFPFVTVLSASPEGFLHLQGDRVVTRPIKGTRPRGENREQDGRLARELAASPKDRAENLMIVDLLRNDLGKVCRPGSIQVPELFAVESFPLVHHLVSTVQGRLAPGEDALSLLAACFPGGSITGAPKRRAMEIIRELEQRPRGVYCGSIGWIGYDGDMETNIAIRTLQLQRGRARYWAGGGIVIDSDAQGEYAETLHKAAAFLQVFDGAVQGTAGGRLSHVPPQEGMR